MEDGGACSRLRSFTQCTLEDVLALSRAAAGADLGNFTIVRAQWSGAYNRRQLGCC